MTEQEQAQALAAWLEQPAGTPPPEGLDPDVVESMYAMRPELAPGPTLSADDILDGLDFGAFVGDVSGDEGGGGTLPGASTPPQTPVKPAPAPWRSANRVAGVAVILATAATLLLVVLPSGELADLAPAPEAEEVAAAPASRSAPDPIASVADEAEPAPAAAPQPAPPAVVAEAAPPADAPVPAEGNAVGGDAVVDAEDDYDQALDFATEQRSRFAREDSQIPEVQEALAEDAWEPEMAEAEEAVAAAPQQLTDDQLSSRKERTRAQAPAAPAYDAPAQEPAPTSNRTAAMPGDFDRNAWRRATDPATEALVDEAVKKANAELGMGDVDRAVQHLSPRITAPAAAGQYVAVVATEIQLNAGRLAGAISTAQSGLALDGSNSAARSMLLKLYGDALDRSGDRAGAEAQWSAAAALNATR